MIAMLYPDNWRKLSTELKQICNYRCTACNRQCRRPGEFYLGWDYEAVVAHISQDYHAPEIQVACLCAACHFIHDAPLSGVARRRAERWRQRQAGQLSFLPARG